jgi:hypothetical protein
MSRVQAFQLVAAPKLYHSLGSARKAAGLLHLPSIPSRMRENAPMGLSRFAPFAVRESYRVETVRATGNADGNGDLCAPGIET